MTRRVTVQVERPYDVVVGRGIDAEIIAAVPDRANSVAVLHAPFAADQAQRLAAKIDSSGRSALLIPLPDAEAAKTAATTQMCWDALGAAQVTRTDAIVAIGGGATTDQAGFVAATWLRGIDIIQVPTTVLAMVDAAVGGKTGINTSAGKNLVGSIHPPRAVICDLEQARTLRAADLAAGFAEIVKSGFIRDTTILDTIEADPTAALDPAGPVIDDLTVRAIAVKADVVADDLTESVDRVLGRETLNYGHTLAHAIEKVEQYSWRHGDAVSVGMCFAAALAQGTGELTASDVQRHRTILESLGLPTRYPHPERWPELLATMRIDKKARGATVRFIVLDGIGHPALLSGPSEDELHRAFQEVS